MKLLNAKDFICTLILNELKKLIDKKDEIKSYGAKWDNDKKLWLLTYKKFNKNKYFIKQISSEIIYGCIIDILLKIKTNKLDSDFTIEYLCNM